VHYLTQKPENGDLFVVDDERQFESEFEDVNLDKLSADLKGLCQPVESVPPEVDRRVIDMANRRLRRRPVRQWVGLASAAAVAAVIIFVVSINLPKKTGTPSEKNKSQRYSLMDKSAPEMAAMSVVPADIDGNGHVNILDAFKLARRLESSQVIENQWDINGDGQINHGDVDTIAIVAVSLDKGARL
jgi:hypothetical protein